MSWHFLSENALWLLAGALLVAPLGALAAMLAFKRGKQIHSAWSADRHRKTATQPLSRGRYRLKAVALFVAFAAGFAALARPSIPDVTSSFPAGSRDLVVLVDVSRSMAARDCNGQTRLALAKEILKKSVIPRLNNNRIGIIIFGGRAVPLVFLTYQQDKLEWVVDDSIKISSDLGDGSALGKAFALSFRFYEEDSDAPDEDGVVHKRKKDLLLLSDGGTDDETKYEDIVAGCKKHNVRLIVVGLGQQSPAFIPVSELAYQDRDMQMGEFYTINGERATTAIDDRLLSGLSQAVGGTYIHANEAGDVNYPELASNGNDVQPQTAEYELFQYATVLCLVALVIAGCATGDWSMLKRRGRHSHSQDRRPKGGQS